MNELWQAVRRWCRALIDGWDRFWFQPAMPHTLAAIRMFAGAMLFYSHFVLALDLESFLGPDAWFPRSVSLELHRQQGSFTWSHLWLFDSPTMLWVTHSLALAVFFLLTIGLFTRVVSVLAWLLAVSYCHRLTGSLFGLDQINTFMAMYLMVGRCGAVWSVDRWLERRRLGEAHEVSPAISTNVAIRLLQLHICIIYLFGGIGKMRGEMWWDGSATWYAVANYEYQSMDMTWLVHYPVLSSVLTHITVFWETFYCFLVWPKLTRPIALALAVAVHGGIAACLGMITFGTAMLIGNLSFVPPETTASIAGWFKAAIHPPRQPATAAEQPRRRRRS